MDFDDIVIGSGLAALGAVLGLDAQRRVLVFCGPPQGAFLYYDEERSVPCAYLGEGGLGNNWHGVIPTGLSRNFASSTEEDFASVFARFYPATEIRSRLYQPWLFVPWRPIRPRRALARIAAERKGRVMLAPERAQHFRTDGGRVEVTGSSGTYRARCVWIAAGALHTPALLDRSLDGRLGRGRVSDHVLCYVGQVDRAPPPKVAYARDGMFFPAAYDPTRSVLYTLRPARFAFGRLDYGIEQRAAFGLPTGGAVRKIVRGRSAGLLAEAVYNRFGLFAAAPSYSVYAQVPVRDAYALRDGPLPLKARPEVIRAATDTARRLQPFAGVRPSRRPELYIAGIHLHHSLDLEAVIANGINAAGSTVQVVDGSASSEIGPDHPSFKVMLAAWDMARRAT